MFKLKKLTMITIPFILLITSIYFPGDKSGIEIPNTWPIDSISTEWIIKWEGNTYPSEVLDQAIILDWLPDLRVTRIKVKSNVILRDWVKKWSGHPKVEYMQPNYSVKIAQYPNDTYNMRQNYLQQVNAQEGWDVVTNSDVTIAILDTGVDSSHPDLKSNMIEGINLLDREKPPTDDNGHGTNVAGIVAAVGNNVLGITGMTWKTKLMPIKVLDENGDGNSFFIGQGIRYAVDNGAKIIILSLGEAVLAPFMKESVDYAEEKGVLIVAASGNDGTRINYPAALPNVLSVGAVDFEDNNVYYSNFGQQLDVVAPGNEIYTTKSGGDYVYNSGTSMAAPQVAGLAALIMQKYPRLTPYEVSNLIKFTADDVGEVGWDVKSGYGRINVGRALNTPLSILDDWYEPNQTYANASIFPIGDFFKAQLTDRDVDWYKMILPYDGSVSIDLLLEESLTHGVQISIYSSDDLLKGNLNTMNEQIRPNNMIENIGKKPESTNKNNGEEGPSQEKPTEPLTFIVRNQQRITIDVPKGDLYLKVSFTTDQLKSSEKRVKYSLINQFKIYKDRYELNDKPWLAYEVVNLKEKLIGTFDKENDNDWYKVKVNQNGTLSATVRVDSYRLDPVLILQPLDRIGSIFDYNVEEFGYIRVSPGEYYVKVSDYNNYATMGEYEVEFNFKSDDGDAQEPNDLSVNATLLTFNNKEVVGSILNEVDQDWFYFNLKDKAYLNMDFGSDYEAEVTLYNKNLEVIAQNIGVEWKDSNIYDEGSYYIRLNSKYSLNQYSLRFLKYDMYGDFIDIADHWARDMIIMLHNEKLMVGYQDHTFRPENEMTRGKVAEILFHALDLPVPKKQNTITDVSESHKQYQAIASINNAGIMSTYEDHSFKPSKTVSRQELVTILTRAYQIPILYDPTQRVSDVGMDNSAFYEINTFIEYGWLFEFIDFDLFMPKQPVTRAEFAGLLVRVREFAQQKENLVNGAQETIEPVDQQVGNEGS